MSKISKEKEEKIARGEEFVLRLMKELQVNGLVLMREESGKLRVKRKWGLKGGL